MALTSNLMMNYHYEGTTIDPIDIESPNFIWTISNSSIATVDNGFVTALTENTTDIFVRLDLNGNTLYDVREPFDIYTITVNESVIDPVAVTSVTLSQTSASLGIN